MTPIEQFQGFGVAAAVSAALKTGLLSEIAKNPAEDGELARRLGLDPRAVSLVLDVLASLGLVRRDGARVVLGEVTEATARGPGGARLTLEMWGHVERFLQTGEPFVLMDQDPDARELAYRDVVADLAAMFEGPARELAAKLSTAPRRVLDVGCGSGVWGLAIAERHPDASVTGLDLPAVLETFRARARALSLSGRAHTLPGNMHDTTLPEAGFDLVVIANVIRLEPPPVAESLLRRLARAVAPGGSLVVVDALAGGTPAREHERRLYALHLGLRTRTGEVHRPEAVARWLTAAGLSDVTAIDFAEGRGGLGAMLARKP